MIWFTSDTHWGHKNIIKHTERPFGSVRQMDEALVKNWNRVVKKGDIVYHLGDVGHKCSPAYLKKILDQLNGRIYLIHGNHDRVAMSTQCKGRFESITPLKEAFITDSSSRKGRRVIVLCHYAMRVWNMRHWGSWHLYGHSHGTGDGTWQGIPIFNLGSPYYLSYNPDGRGHYTVFRITDGKIYAFDVSWDPADPTSLQAPDNWTRVVDLP